MSDALPEGWATAPLDTLCERLRGVSYPRADASSSPKPGYIPILRANNIEADALRFEDLVWIPKSRVSDKQIIRKGDVVVAMSSGSKSVVGKTAQALDDWEGSFGAFCGVLRVSPELNKHFLGLFLRTREYRWKISDLAAGTNINNLKAEHFSEITVPLAPVGEQRRIVAKLEKLLGKVDACQRRLAKIPRLLKRFRQSVLAAACSGRLTADWREENREPLVGVGDIDDKLPQSWAGCALKEVASVISGFAFSSAEFTDSGVPAIKISNVQYGEFVEKNQEHLPEAFLAEYPAFVVLPRTLLMALTRPITNDTLKVCLYPESAKPGLLNQRVCKIEPSVRIDRDYLHMFMQTRSFKRQVQENLSETLQPNLSPKALDSFAVALPPLAEQRKIVRRVEQLFTLADQLEARYAKAQAHVDKLTQSLLAKAFRGELVPQDPNDEPASVLLERIKAQRPDSVSAGKRKRHAVQPALAC